MAHCSESILQAITGGANSSPQPQPGQSGKRLCQRTASSSSMTCCLPMSEPLALTVLLQQIQTLTWKPPVHMCVRLQGGSSFIYTQTHTVYNGVHVPFLSQVRLWIAGCRADGAAGRTLPHRCSAEEVYATSHAQPPQVKKQVCLKFEVSY